MDSGEVRNALEKCQVISAGKDNSLGCLSIMNGEMDLSEKVCEAESVEERATLVPVTPDISAEGRDRETHHIVDSPVALPSNKLKEKACVEFGMDRNGNGDDSPSTPEGEIFDPFARGGSDDLLMAPRCKKRLDELTNIVIRSLDFGTCSKVPETREGNEDATFFLSDEEMVESVYDNLLETILSNKIEDVLAEMGNVDWDDEACKTPTSAPRLTGIGETCPGAPKRAAAGSRKIDLSLCRKLEF